MLSDTLCAFLPTYVREYTYVAARPLRLGGHGEDGIVGMDIRPSCSRQRLGYFRQKVCTAFKSLFVLQEKVGDYLLNPCKLTHKRCFPLLSFSLSLSFFE